MDGFEEDAILVARALSGAEEAFGCLMARYRKMAFGIGRSMLQARLYSASKQRPGLEETFLEGEQRTLLYVNVGLRQSPTVRRLSPRISVPGCQTTGV